VLRSVITSYFLLCSVIFCSFGYANEKDSLAILQIDSLLEETEKLRTSNNLENLTTNLTKLKELSSHFSLSQRCQFDFLNAYQLTILGQNEKAIELLLFSSAECQIKSNRVKIKALLANLYALSGNYYKAISTLDSLLSHLDDIDEPAVKHMAYMVSIVVYDIVNQPELSLKFIDLLLEGSPPEIYQCKAQVYRYISYFKTNQDKDYSTEVPKIFQFCLLQNENLYAHFVNIYWFKYRLKQLDSQTNEPLKQLLSDLNRVREGIDKTKYKNLIVMKNSILAQIYYKLNNFESAEIYAQHAVNEGKLIGTTEQQIVAEALQVLIDIKQMQGYYQAANKYLQEKNNSVNKFYTDKQAKLMAYQTIKHENLANTYQIKMLNQQNDLLQLEKALAEESKTNQRLVSTLLASLVLFSILLMYRMRKQQQKFKALSELDHMTMIYNRKGIKQHMDYILPYSEKKQEQVAYAIFDLDFFKKINDKYGHVIGDWVIKQAILACQEIGNKKITFARIGGEEFSLTMRDSTIDEINEMCEQCRIAINSIQTKEETGHEFRISASFGISTSEVSGYSYSKLMAHADSALYNSKHKGRNQVSFYC